MQVHHTYQDSGTYTITLTVIDSSGCTDTNSFNVRIHPNPTADIIFSNTCDENPVNFQINTINGDGIITEWQFDYINGLNNSGNLSQNIPSSLQFTYPQCGDYAISLFIRDSLTSPFGQGTLLIGTDDNNNYCESTIDTTITIYCPPIANIVSVDPYVCEGDTSFFTNFSQQGPTPSAPIDTLLYSWNFGGNGLEIVPHQMDIGFMIHVIYMTIYI